MKRGKCLKCERNEVYRIEDHVNRWAKISFFSEVFFVDYICCHCGYTESYVENLKGLLAVKRKGKKVRVAG